MLRLHLYALRGCSMHIQNVADAGGRPATYFFEEWTENHCLHISLLTTFMIQIKQILFYLCG